MVSSFLNKVQITAVACSPAVAAVKIKAQQQDGATQFAQDILREQIARVNTRARLNKNGEDFEQTWGNQLIQNVPPYRQSNSDFIVNAINQDNAIKWDQKLWYLLKCLKYIAGHNEINLNEADAHVQNFIRERAVQGVVTYVTLMAQGVHERTAAEQELERYYAEGPFERLQQDIMRHWGSVSRGFYPGQIVEGTWYPGETRQTECRGTILAIKKKDDQVQYSIRWDDGTETGFFREEHKGHQNLLRVVQ